MKDCSAILQTIENQKDRILAAERWIWKHPETGYREWKTHAYLKEQYEALGCRLKEFGDIPGFYTDFDTGRPGPTFAFFGELDSLIVPTHPECDPETGAVHACGHHCQSAGLLGMAIGLSSPGALDGLCGRIRLIAVPAEELIELEYRQRLKDSGRIRFFGGKQELLARGLLDDVDLTMMIHTGGMNGFFCGDGNIGCMIKQYTFRGVAAHAGGSPHNGVNALYAANLAMNAANALRETFKDSDHVRFHPIITAGGSAVSSIPDCVTVESYIRAGTIPAIVQYNEKINRAFAAAAAAIGCTLTIKDLHGYAPRINYPGMKELVTEAAREILPPEKISAPHYIGTGSTDMGDISCVIPSASANIGGWVGHAHGNDLYITDPYLATVVSAKIQVLSAVRMLENDAAAAKKILAEEKPLYGSIPEYLDTVEKLNFTAEAVRCEKDGSVTLHYKP